MNEPQTDVLVVIPGVIVKFPFVPLKPPTTVNGIVPFTQFYFETVRLASLEHTPNDDPNGSFQPVKQEVQVLAAEDEQVLHV